MPLPTTQILELPVATSLSGSEYAPVVQGGVTKRAEVSLFDISSTGGGPQDANTVFAGPASGVDANPTFRTLVSADIPAALTLGVAGTSLGSLILSGNTSGAVTIAPQAAAGTFNFNLPTTAGTSGYVLTSGGGGSSPMTWTNPGSLGIDLDIGTTAITNGTTTRILYDNAGVLGEYTITGSGTVVAMQTAPTFVTSITSPIVYGGSAAGSTLSLRSTSSGAPSADAVSIYSTGVERANFGTSLVINESGADFDVRMEGDTDANLFSLDASGDKIGIGIAVPAYKLQVSGVQNANSISSHNSSTGGVANLSINDTYGQFGTLTNTPLALVANNSVKAYILANGNFGIANTNPGSLLHLGTAGATLGVLSMSGNTSGTITIQPQAAAGTFNFNLPTTAGTSGYVLTSGGGGSSPMTWTDPTALATDLNVGSTAIVGGATTRILYDNAGVLGEYTISGSGTVVAMATGPTLASPTITTSPTAAGATWTNLGTVTTADINGGTIDGTIIGGASAAAGTFTNHTITNQLQATLATGIIHQLTTQGTGFAKFVKIHTSGADDQVLNISANWDANLGAVGTQGTNLNIYAGVGVDATATGNAHGNSIIVDVRNCARSGSTFMEMTNEFNCLVAQWLSSYGGGSPTTYTNSSMGLWGKDLTVLGSPFGQDACLNGITQFVGQYSPTSVIDATHMGSSGMALCTLPGGGPAIGSRAGQTTYAINDGFVVTGYAGEVDDAIPDGNSADATVGWTYAFRAGGANGGGWTHTKSYSKIGTGFIAFDYTDYGIDLYRRHPLGTARAMYVRSDAGSVGIWSDSGNDAGRPLVVGASRNGEMYQTLVNTNVGASAATGIEMLTDGGQSLLFTASVAAGGYTALRADGNLLLGAGSGSAIGLQINATDEIIVNTTAIYPASDGGSALGTTSNAWNGLHLNTGTAINWENGDVTITHASNDLAFAGATKYTFDASLIIGYTSAIANKIDTNSITPRSQVTGTDSDTSSGQYARFSANATGPFLFLSKSRGASPGTFTVVNDGDQLGNIIFSGADGTDMASGARIAALVSGTPGADDMPTALVFYTAPDGSESPSSFERLRIAPNGGISMGTSTANTISGIGFKEVPYNLGNTSGTTITPDAANGNKQYCSNNGSWTLNPPAAASTIELEITNTTGAAIPTTSGFTIVNGDALTATTTDEFIVYITKTQNYSMLTVCALQ